MISKRVSTLKLPKSLAKLDWTLFGDGLVKPERY